MVNLQIKPSPSGNTGPQQTVARMGHDHKTDAIFFDLFHEVFPKQKWVFPKRNYFLKNENALI